MYNSIGEDGNLIYYDGIDDALLNVDGKILFTHEFLQGFLDQSGEGRLSFSGYWRAQVKLWKSNFAYFSAADIATPPFVQSCLDLINRPFMEAVFLESVFDYITLLKLDYVDAFSCDCDLNGEADKCLDRNTLTAVYDNCCKFLQSLMLRYPPMAQHYQFIIDNIHHSGHSNCSPHYNHKMSLAVSMVNASINEQKNKLLRYMETSLAFMGQIRGCVLVR